jgi:hypothetical protein
VSPPSVSAFLLGQLLRKHLQRRALSAIRCCRARQTSGRSVPTELFARPTIMTWKKWASRLAWFAAGAVITAALQHAFAIRDHLWQIQNLVKGRAYVAALANYRAVHRTYPARLDIALPRDRHWLDGRDAWGARMAYESDGQRFILVSFGADRHREYYGSAMDLRLAAITPGNTPFPFWSTCGDPAADQVMSDVGEHRVCGK